MNDYEPTGSLNLPMESMKVIAESVGVAGLSDSAAKELADEINFRIKTIIQDSTKFMHHGKRKKLSTTDIDNALKIKNIEVMLFSINVALLFVCCLLTKHILQTFYVYITAFVWILQS